MKKGVNYRLCLWILGEIWWNRTEYHLFAGWFSRNRRRRLDITIGVM